MADTTPMFVSFTVPFNPDTYEAEITDFANKRRKEFSDLEASLDPAHKVHFRFPKIEGHEDSDMQVDPEAFLTRNDMPLRARDLLLSQRCRKVPNPTVDWMTDRKAEMAKVKEVQVDFYLLVPAHKVNETQTKYQLVNKQNPGLS